MRLTEDERELLRDDDLRGLLPGYDGGIGEDIIARIEHAAEAESRATRAGESGGEAWSALSWAERFGRALWWKSTRGPGPKNEETLRLQELFAVHGHPAPDGLNPFDTRYEETDLRYVKDVLALGLDRARRIAARNNRRVGEWPDLSTKRPEVVEPKIEYPYKTNGEHRLALFADFGTGAFVPRHMARMMARRGYAQVFHLGDVYYCGTASEYARNLEEPLQPLLKLDEEDAPSTYPHFYNLADNHDMFCGGDPYLAFLARCRSRGRTRQSTSYFCIEFDRHRILGLDVNWFANFKEDMRQVEWLARRLRESDAKCPGRDKTTILLSGGAAYDHGKETAVYRMLKETGVLQRVDIWFWGHHHHCAVYEMDRLGFRAICIGHGGFPGYRVKANDALGRRVEWAETERRYKWTGIREELGNNGWCELVLKQNGDVVLRLVDWLGALRYSADFVVQNGATRWKGTANLPLTYGDSPELLI